jgi:hypothetical protein
MKKILVGLAAALLGLATAASGQDQSNGQYQANGQVQSEASPGTARVSMIHGDVSTQRGDSGDWNAATLNTPVMAGDQISTAANSRAEIQLDYANTLRLDQNTVARVVGLTQGQIQVQVSQGLMSFTVLNGSEASTEIDTPNVAVHPLKDGSYRIEVISDGETHVIVRRGEAEITTPQGSTQVEAGQMISIQGTANDAQYQTVEAPSSDDWDGWNSDRDRLISHAESWRHTDRYYVGTHDLDTYGHWQNVPDYGDVWVPTQRADWAPYRDGRWTWEPYYGWTWVSYEPWGWAPYHYGRWFVNGGSWAWWPGPVAVGYGYPVYRPVWAPAYVSFIGFGGGGVGFGFGFGNVGWLPIGPCDGFFPWYGRERNEVNVTNITNITNVTNIRNHGGVPPLLPDPRGRGILNVRGALTNARIREGISSMPAGQFGKGGVPARRAAIDEKTLRQGGMLTGRVPITPTKDSFRSVSRPASPGTIPARAGNAQHFFSKAQAGAAASRPFNDHPAQGRKTIEAPRTSPSSGAGTRTSATPNVRTQAPPTGARPTFPSSGAGAVRNTTPSQTTSSQRPGWHTFGSGNTGTPVRPSGPGSPQTGNRGQFTPPTQPNNGPGAAAGRFGWPSYSRPGNSSRPPLNLHQPIVTQRSQSTYSNGGRGGYAGSSNRPPSGGSYQPPNRGSSQPPSGGSYRPPSGGSYQPPNRGSYQPPSHGSYQPPSHGSYQPPSHGSYQPPSGGSYRPPSGGSSRPPSGGSYRPPSGGGYRPPSSGSSGRPNGGGGGNQGGGGHSSPPPSHPPKPH